MPEVLEVFLSILGILAIVIAGAFVIVFVVDLLISIIDSKNGIFFKRSKPNETSTSLVANNEVIEDKNIEKYLPESTIVEDKIIDDTPINTGIDYEAAKREQEELLKLRKEEQNYKEIPTEKEIKVLSEIDKTEDEEEKSNIYDFNMPVEEIKPKEEQIADILEEYEDILEKDKEIKEQEEEVFDFDFATEKSADTLSIVTDNIVDKNLEIEKAQADLKLAQSEAEKQEILNQLNDLLDEKENLIKFAQEAKETLDLMEKEREEAVVILTEKDNEIQKLKAELAAAKEQQAIIKTEYIKEKVSGSTEEELEARLAVLEERLKSNEKELKKVRKEFRPLESVRKSLESYKKKLNRKEAIVAKQNVLLYGVNNYVDIDDEKAKKLTEEHELLDGLRMSVRQCEETIENSKDRYPVLEQSYKILTKNNKEIRDDIDLINEELAILRNNKEEA